MQIDLKGKVTSVQRGPFESTYDGKTRIDNCDKLKIIQPDTGKDCMVKTAMNEFKEAKFGSDFVSKCNVNAYRTQNSAALSFKTIKLVEYEQASK